MSLTGDNRIDALRTVHSICDVDKPDSEELRKFKEKIKWYTQMGLDAWNTYPQEQQSLMYENMQLREEHSRFFNNEYQRVVKRVGQLQSEFDSYKETAEEISQCYNNSHSDSWVLEEALRKIVQLHKDAEQYTSVPQPTTAEYRIASETLEKVWKRREARGKSK